MHKSHSNKRNGSHKVPISVINHPLIY